MTTTRGARFEGCLARYLLCWLLVSAPEAWDRRVLRICAVRRIAFVGGRVEQIERICRLLKQMRLERGLTLRDVERRSGVSFSTVSLMENGRHAFSLENLMKLAEAYEVPVSHFFREEPRLTRARD